MGEQGVDAGLGAGRVEDELGLAVFQGYCIVVVNLDRPVGALGECGADTEDGEVGDPDDSGGGQQDQERVQKETLEFLFAGARWGHGAIIGAADWLTRGDR